MLENVDVSKLQKYRAPALLLLIVACVAVAAFRNVVSLGIISYVHLFYVPAIIAGLWYGRKSIEIAMPLGIIEILLNFLNAGQLTPAAFLDGFLLIVVASIVGVLSENKDQLNEKLKDSVEKLSRQNEELGQRETALRESEARFRVLAETTPSVILIIQHGRLVYANPAAERVLGYRREELNAMGPAAMDIIDPEQKDLIDHGAIMEALRGGGTVCREMRIRTRSGAELWMYMTAGLMRFEDDGALMVTGFDVTARRLAEEKLRASLHEKDVLLKEVHHRVKNNLQVVSSMLSLQSMSQSDSATVCLFRESQDRVRSMALIHEQLYRAGDLSRIDFGEYADSLTANLLRSYTAGGTIKLNIDVRDILISIDLAIPCGLIVNELVSNALKHAFPDGRTGTVTVAMRREGTEYVLAVKDDGVYMPRHVDHRNSGSFGLQLVDTLAGQLEGSISLDGNGGTAYTIRFIDRSDRRTKNG
jgi:PAS domain S-box-containing protein